MPEAEIVVVDASVLVELVVDGRHRGGADLLLSRYAATPPLTLVSAAHAIVESVSALRRLSRHGDVSTADGEAAVAWLAELDIVLDAPARRSRRIWQLRHAMTAYDAAYAAVAESLATPLVTVDARLCRACAEVGIDAVDLDDFSPPAR